MIRIGDNSYRNLEEQVLKNKQDIADHYNVDRVLADFGITIVGYARTASELPDPLSYQGEYGDGYYVGYDAPYNFYIYTRPNPDAGHYTNYWLNIGQLAIAGPEGSPGPRGDAGPVGPRGSIWTSVYDTLPQAVNYNVNDQVLRTYDGNVYECKLDVNENKYWSLIGNIQGTQGIQGPRGIQGPAGPEGPIGPKGDTGDVGGFINIYSVLSAPNQLPSPATLNNLTIAYLVGSSAPYDLYVQTGNTSDGAVWTNTGPFNAATAVNVNGDYQNIWNADTKLDKVTSNTTYNQAYVKMADGTQSTFNMSHDALEGSIAVRTASGQLRTTTPTAGIDAANKTYVDNAKQFAVNYVDTYLDATETRFNSLEAQIASNYQRKLTAGEGISIENNVISATSQSAVNQWLVRVFHRVVSVGYFEVYFNVLAKEGTEPNINNLLTILGNMGTTSVYRHPATGATGIGEGTMRNSVIGVYKANDSQLGVVYYNNDSPDQTQLVTLTDTNTTIKVYNLTTL